MITAARRRQRRDSGKRARPPCILLVDDATEEREIYAQALIAAGYLALEAANGRAAVAMANSAPPDLILLDLSMPVMGGLEAIRLLKVAPRTRSIPVVILTGASLDRTWAATAAGCDALLVKPCSYDDLIAVVHDVLAAREASVTEH